MTEKPILRDFVFFDREKVESFLSSYEGGITRQRTETQRKASGGAKAQLNVGILKAGGSLEKKGMELQELKSATDASLFQLLYDHLKSGNMIRALKSIDDKVWGEIERGEILEVEGRIGLSIMENLSGIMTSLLSLLKSQGNVDQKSLEMFSAFAGTWPKQGFNIKVTIKNNEKFKIIATLPERDNCIRATKQEFEGEHWLFCRVKRKLEFGETYDLFSLLPGAKIDQQLITNLAKNSPADFSKLMGKDMKVEDFTIGYPAMIVTPIAIYE